MSLFEENAAILAALKAEGHDLARPHAVDFSHLFDDRASADTFALAAQGQGFSMRVESYEPEPGRWDVTASRVMEPSCRNITDVEAQLSEVAGRHGGCSDGWCFFDA